MITLTQIYNEILLKEQNKKMKTRMKITGSRKDVWITLRLSSVSL